jgi:uncharacterized OsmC-like protein
MSEEPRFTFTMEQLQDFEFKVKFDWDGVADLLLDEPAPLGRNAGPNASRLVGAAVGNCLTASLLFCLRKSRVQTTGMKTTVSGTMTRNEKGRMRLGGFDVRIAVEGLEDPSRAQRCLGLFEDFCVVTASVKQGIPVSVEVVDDKGNKLA